MTAAVLQHGPALEEHLKHNKDPHHLHLPFITLPPGQTANNVGGETLRITLWVVFAADKGNAETD